MTYVLPRFRAATILLAGMVGCAIASSAWAHVQASSTSVQNRIKMIWKFPCSGPPPVQGERDSSTRGDPPDTPPPDLVMGTAATDPEDSANHLLMGALCTNGETQVVVQAYGCAIAGVNQIESTTTPPSASVGMTSGTDIVPSPDAMRVQIERTVVPGPTPDLIRLTLSGGGMQTRILSPGDQAHATLKLIVYPDQATADADVDQLVGAGSAFFGGVTLDGVTGSLINLSGFSIVDFLLQNDGVGQFTARPVLGLSRIVLVPDANTAVVSMVGDPQVGPSSTTAVSTPVPRSGVWLGSALPNPARGTTRIPFAMPSAARVTLTVFDQQGRLVRQLVDGALPAGDHSAVWDGRNAEGRPSPSGLYLYRLDVGGKRLSGKVFSIH